MKKIFSILLACVMLLGIMATTAFAADMDPWDLEDFGQKTFTVKVSDTAPVIDGKIEAGEYTLAETGLKVANKATDGRFFVVDKPGDISVDIYMNYDGDRFYFGIVINDDNRFEERGANNVLDGYAAIYMGADKNDFSRKNMLKIELNPEDETFNRVDESATVIEGNTTIYEIAVKKNTLLDQYGIDELDNQIYLMIMTEDVTEESLTNSGLWNEVYFGFSSSELKEIFPGDSARYCHVVTFEEEAPETEAHATEAPATEAPVTDAPVADAPATDAPTTDAPAAEGGCGASVAAMGVALVAALGTCTAFISKKR